MGGGGGEGWGSGVGGCWFMWSEEPFDVQMLRGSEFLGLVFFREIEGKPKPFSLDPPQFQQKSLAATPRCVSFGQFSLG